MSANGATDTTALTRGAVEARGVEPKPAPAVPQYATGFEGAASAPFPAEAAAVLGAAVNPDEVEIRTDGIVYLPGVAYRRLLTRAFGMGAWALLPRGPARTVGDAATYPGALFILGRFVSEAVGECRKNAGMSEASAIEGARTDCLTRCCKDLGMATELWDPTWRASWIEKYAVKVEGKWRLRDKATNGNLATGRNVGAQLQANLAGNGGAPPKGDPVPPTAPSGTSKSTSDSSGEPTSTPSTITESDTGEAPDQDTVTGIRNAVRDLQWKGAQAKRWLSGAFGVDSPDALTARQAADALQLLVAAQVDDSDASYNDVRAKLVADGRVKS